MIATSFIVPRCASCGCSLDGTKSADLCLPCLIAQAKKTMADSIGLSESAVEHSRKKSENISPQRQAVGKGVKNFDASKMQASSRSLKAEKRRQREELINEAKMRRRRQPIQCLLCGEAIPPGTLLSHKQAVHGESLFSEPDRKARRSKSIWTPVFSGGLPGLGKRR